MQNDNLVTA